VDVDGQHLPVDQIHIRQDPRVHRRPSQMETTRTWCGQASERGRLKARQGKGGAWPKQIRFWWRSGFLCGFFIIRR